MLKKLYPVLYMFQVCMLLGLTTNFVIASNLWSIQDAVFLLGISLVKHFQMTLKLITL